MDSVDRKAISEKGVRLVRVTASSISCSLSCLFLAFAVLSFAGCEEERRYEKTVEEKLPRTLPEFSFKNLKGEQVSSEQLKGRVRMIHFWATWCPPCVAELPAMQKLYQGLEAEGLEIYAISTDAERTEPKVREFAAENKLSFDVLLDPHSSLNEALMISGYPETVFVDEQNRLIWFDDPKNSSRVKKVIADRDWSDPRYIAAVREMLIRKQSSASQ